MFDSYLQTLKTYLKDKKKEWKKEDRREGGREGKEGGIIIFNFIGKEGGKKSMNEGNRKTTKAAQCCIT